jgi:hypothetical protein
VSYETDELLDFCTFKFNIDLEARSRGWKSWHAQQGDRIRRCGDITERYVAPAPRELPELRARLARWLSGTGPVFYLTAALTGRQRLPSGVPPDTGAARVAAQERRRVLAGELYWVSAAMTRLARHAAQSLPSWNLYRHDLPSDCGLMVFEQPLGSYTNDEAREVEIVAASWGPRKGPGRSWANGGVALSFYSHPAPVLPRGAFQPSDADPLAGPYLAAGLPPILPDNEAGWPFGDLDVLPPRTEGTTVQWARVLATRRAEQGTSQPRSPPQARPRRHHRPRRPRHPRPPQPARGS